MSNTRYTLSGGMNNKLPAEHLPDGTAALIQNMRMRDDGAWEAVKIPQYLDTIQFETPHVWRWEPAYMPETAGKDETGVWVYFGDGGCSMYWLDAAGELATQKLLPFYTLVLEKLRVSWDAQQFVFVDGREGKGAQRITINPEGEINCRAFGTQQPITAPIVNQIDNSKYEDNKYTGMAVGSILYYAYCIVNEYGERSNPSPVTVCDTAQWLAKGELLVDEYQYTDENGGSIKSVSVTCPIPVPEEARRIELYRTHAEYFESFKPVDPMRLVRSLDLQGTSQSITITDASFTSPVEIDYENDTAPAGDDIVLESGTLFVANAVAHRTFAYPVSRVWMIHLDNLNSINYVNRWFTIDIRDETNNLNLPHFVGLTSAADICAPATRYRFVDTDMITPLKAYMAPFTANQPNQLKTVAGNYISYCNLTHIQIPYMMASAEKIIYLVEFEEPPVDEETGKTIYANPCIKLDGMYPTAYKEFWNGKIDNPVRNENCLIAQGTVRNAPKVVGGHQITHGNKANAIYAAINYNKPTQINPIPVALYDEVKAMSYQNNGRVNLTSNDIYYQGSANFRGWRYGSGIFENVGGIDATQTGLPGASRGYVYGHIVSTKNGGSVDLFTLRTEMPEKNTSFDFRLMRCILTRYSDYIQVEIQAKLLDEWEGWGDIQAIQGFITIGEPVRCMVDTSDNENELLQIFVFWSWAKEPTTPIPSPSPDLIYDHNDTLLGVIVQKANGQTKMKSYKGRQLNYFQDMPVEIQMNSHGDMASGLWYLNIGEYIDDPREIVTFYNFGTHFESPTTVIGWRDAVTNGCVKNLNVTWEAYELRNEYRPGRIRWGMGASVPESYERNVYQEIKRIIPVKSWQPTDEHNTLLIWTKDKVLRMSLAGDNQQASALITELTGVGLQNPDELTQITEGVIWKDGDSVYLLSANSLKEIGRHVVDLTDEKMTALYDKKNKEVLFVPEGGNAYCYNLKWDVWSKLDYGLEAMQFIEYDGRWCLVAEGVYDLDPEDDTKLPPKIRTKKHPARRKLHRLTINPSSGTARAYIYNHRLAAGCTVTPTYTLGGQDPKGIPQLCGDYVQFEIVTDTINTYDIEATD